MEQTTKTIFDALTELHEVVVFFDEIDRMILDRDSAAYGEQNDIFQFMTPGMLPKLTELRRAGRSTFIIATNFAERIDPAIKRGGRIDENVLCLPFHSAARVEQLKRLMIRRAEKEGIEIKKTAVLWDSESEAAICDIAKKTPLYVYEGLKTLMDKASAEVTVAHESYAA